ncbi:hypothetical protein CEUSTIGMA_g9187.t1 [Chlamydomonas eustigma]|uniref:Uncharacterized protein n=1 Tax=Chlamydomonas eustigma TaxID=1157962 RepID=A0A250XFS5_9CHLO|nr:hypothetical protein CEUSTIGMA_g9187.t1 [Chlamydomonas eustigma]|eukprot:GAX81759.1 hypothetical protein CEUSTIGMA_g9187.t1 [Chlamydomonas eustigma]
MRGVSGIIVSFYLLLLIKLSSAYVEGEFIPTARKSQFHGVRTQWHDLLGSYCPRHGQDRTVALPLPQPQAALQPDKDDYKIQLSFDSDRLFTSWIKVLGPGAPRVPVVEIHLRRAGEELLGVTAQVLDAPISYLHSHPTLADEWRNESAWPKHLLIVYRFKSEQEIDLDRGLYVIIALALVCLFILMLNAASGSEAKLAHFLQDVVAASDLGVSSASGSSWKGDIAKGD